MNENMQWYQITNEEACSSPALVVYPDRIKANIAKMIQIAGGTHRLRPHVKTHKMAEVVKLQLDMEITQFKCATLSELEMCLGAGAPDVLLAYSLTGPNVSRYFDLVDQYPEASLSIIVDNETSFKGLAEEAALRQSPIRLYLDINNGMNRTGIVPGPGAEALYQLMYDHSFVELMGFHVYDGHIHETELGLRTDACHRDFEPVLQMKQALERSGYLVPNIVAGGTPTFPIHAVHTDRVLSPGTPLLWDGGYDKAFPDLDFLPAAVLLSRVVSRPLVDRCCLDLGHKAVASEMVHPRIYLLGQTPHETLMHSEEHLVLTDPECSMTIGQAVYAIPTHICPTVALHDQVYIVENNSVIGQWAVTARSRGNTL
ncbi:D-TA family PLP-dependent enzyme [Reichenbachiella agariperforans]|uniref:D-TA family PLP-dependent enzyme n=1 Tax=Reichenbachiella agariperforans TaxID=156994 RepID=UPI001C08454D|nr:D-TA family PLP-dependent enzyme [Reichenbachiella agariperforans]MBU2914471.1 D-TA family PLP-dependent enzyme [Reichenbachiella agariperforans]